MMTPLNGNSVWLMLQDGPWHAYDMASDIISPDTIIKMQHACAQAHGHATPRYSTYSMNEWSWFLCSIGVAYDTSCTRLVVQDAVKYTMACLRYGF